MLDRAECLTGHSELFLTYIELSVELTG